MVQPMYFGAWLRQRRLALDLTQAELARRVGCAKVTLQKIELEERRPSKEMAERLAEVLDLSTDARGIFIRCARGHLAADHLSVVDGPPVSPARVSRPVTHLPVLRERLLGRELDLERVRELVLRNDAGLVTLTGTGGIGKTRLALELAHGLRAEFPDGVWWVELAPLSDSTLVANAVRVAVGLEAAANGSIEAALIQFLRARHALLVLDNCEHLRDASAMLIATLLNACPFLVVLATSREPLGVRSEIRHALSSLALPPASSRRSVNAIAHSPAVQLFVARACERQPQFALNDTNADGVATICRRVDGLPLAIELAAAWIDTLAIQDIAVRLSDVLGFLSRGARTTAARQQTMSAVLDWSFALLDGPAQALFGRLAVFIGGFTLEAVEATCDGEPIEATTILRLLSRLIESSLVQVNHHSNATRYHLLEPVRQYARMHLEAWGKLPASGTRHAQYYLTLAETAVHRLHGPNQVEWLHRLDLEHANLQAAVSWCYQHAEQATLGLRLLSVLWAFWRLRGHAVIGYQWCTRLLGESRLVLDPVHAAVLVGAGYLAFENGNVSAAAAHVESALAQYQTLADPGGIADAKRAKAVIAIRHNRDTTTARRLLQESLDLYRGQHDRPGEARVLRDFGDAAFVDEDDTSAGAWFTQSLSIARQLGDADLIGALHGDLAWVAFRSSNLAQAQLLCQQSIDAARQLGNTRYLARRLRLMGNIRREQGELDLAERLYLESLAIHQDAGIYWGMAGTLYNLGTLALERQAIKEAEAYLVESVQSFDQVHNVHGCAEALLELALVATMRSNAVQAAMLLGAADAIFDDIGQRAPDQRVKRIRLHLQSAISASERNAAHSAGRLLSPKDAIATVNMGTLPDVEIAPTSP